ncbi:putative glycoprotease family protein [Lasiodiplodia theobromae]|uniref:tRNA N6-adenosine threonylcarbamoyltransferase n=1 Tax=Lasiodiplodia theobromae TaxID=45133 RepID=A0A5N5DAM6_9PEZI|nr:Glycoprotease family protein [Lasiodiplodia theobromae]KAB2574224.1 tRNA N6-adenosine threonylcarbamoyltransferase [Lasiodiplodia theobromae]KAF4543088.1 Glycoprotease family protein [Lasiodiplodia theobromae]KAF9635661.1 putative glycoprotease family protein [Lasiodiplodia theobromae]
MLRAGSRLRAASRPLRVQRRGLLTLAIETSCDDTSVAVLETRDGCPRRWRASHDAVLHFHEKVTANNLEYRGVHPIVSLESHQENLAALVQKAITHLPLQAEDDDCSQSIVHRIAATHEVEHRQRPDFISVTRGPGMRANLFTGLDTAKGLAVAWNVPLVGVHHMHAHALTPRLVSALGQEGNEQKKSYISSLFGSGTTTTAPPAEPEFPFLSVLVSGGHTLVISSESLTKHRVLGSTTDCAIGDCLDKVARLIVPPLLLENSGDTMYGRLLEGFAFPNGSSDYAYAPPKNRGEELARRPSKWGWAFSPPLAESPNGLRSMSMDMSFTGLHTAVDRVVSFQWDRQVGKLSKIRREPEDVDEEERKVMAREVMRVAFEHLGSRILLALQAIALRDPQRAKTMPVVVSGGVASNRYLRHVLSTFLAARGFQDVKLVYPPPELCTDNAAMIAWAGVEMFRAGHTTPLVCRALRKWSLEELLTPPNGN